MLKFNITKREIDKIIHENKLLFETLEKEKKELKLIQNSMQDGLIILDTKGTVLSCNDSVKKMLGMKDCFIGAKRD